MSSGDGYTLQRFAVGPDAVVTTLGADEHAFGYPIKLISLGTEDIKELGLWLVFCDGAAEHSPTLRGDGWQLLNLGAAPPTYYNCLKKPTRAAGSRRGGQPPGFF
jgi:hypothetical protein